ncbi:MAG: GTP-binding protein [Candidatus Lokiarchaeota archaeon]|nr:GTP-binding protein [Candidatus Lokiarchaeota archaeon]
MKVLTSKSKICLIGEGGVGKTSLLSLLQGREVLEKRVPTVGLEVEDSTLNGTNCSIWDLAGQERFKFMWQDFLRGAGLAVLVCDSTDKNMDKTKEIYDRFIRNIGTKIIAIANKQDLPGALTAQQVQKKLGGIKTYGMSAIRPELRQRMREILEYETSTI